MIDLIFHCLSTNYLIVASTIEQLPLGADINASIYKVQTSDQKTYFVKLKRNHNDISIAILELLQTYGIQQLIPPIKTVDGNQIQQVENFTIIVYPFIQGKDGFNCSLTDDHWIALGKALRQVHEINVPELLKTRIRKEDFSPKWRDVVRSLYNNPKVNLNDEIASKLWKFLQENKSIIQQLVDRSEQLSQNARNLPLKFVLCHSDIHGGNILVSDTKSIYIVDWDDPILAPKERDLMFIGGGVGNVWNKPHEEKQFYQGYEQTNVDWTILAYYRYERIVEDIAVYSQELLLKPIENNNRLEMYKQFMSMFESNGVVDIAFETDFDK